MTSQQLSLRPASSLAAAIEHTLAFPKTDVRDATEAATTMVACYPSGRPADPETYLAAIIALLADYPPEIVAKVADPVHGVVSRNTFMPSVAEVRKALEAEMIPLRRAWRERMEEKKRREAPRPNQFNSEVAKGFVSLVADLAKGMTP